MFLVASSESFWPRTKVCVESIESLGYQVEVMSYEGQEKGGYLEGFAKARLERARRLLETNDEVIVTGADCVFYSAPFELHKTMGNVVLVPHVVQPPKERAANFYQTGHANADLIVFRKGSEEVLDWLLSQDMKADIAGGSFYEQTLLSALPFLFDDVGSYSPRLW